MLLALLIGNRAVERDLLLFGLQADMLRGTRFRDWEAAIVAEMLARRDGSSGDVQANLFGFYHALDCGKAENAGELLDLALARISEHPPQIRRGFFLEAAFFEAFHRRNSGAARAWLEQAKIVPLKDPLYVRAEAAVLLVEGQPGEAIDRAEECLVKLTNTPFPGSNPAICDWINAILAEARQAIPQPIRN